MAANINNFVRKVLKIQGGLSGIFSPSTIGKMLFELGQFSAYLVKKGMMRGTDFEGVKMPEALHRPGETPLVDRGILMASIGYRPRRQRAHAGQVIIEPLTRREQLIGLAHQDPQPRAWWGGARLPRRAFMGFRDREFNHRKGLVKIAKKFYSFAQVKAA